MNITFLIGNGFDLNLNLKTKYSQFLEEYTSKFDDRDLIYVFKNDILEEKDKWADAELAFGDYTESFFPNDAVDFCDCHEDFCEKLGEYLEAQEKNIDFESQKEFVKKAFLNSIKPSNILSGFRETSSTILKNTINDLPGNFNYNFITYNYTHTLDKCIEISSDDAIALGIREYKNSIIQNRIAKLYHVHGYTDHDMVLGLNDESQIKNLDLFKNSDEEYKKQIIKRATNILNENNIDEKVSDLISNSDLIYIYGMSIGQTDAIWWQRIIDAMIKRKHLHVIIHCFDAPKNNARIRTKYLLFEKSQKNYFLSFSDKDEEIKSDLKDRIHIDTNNIFEDLKNIEFSNQNGKVLTRA